MEPISEKKFIVVRRKTRLDDLVTRFNSIAQAKFYIEHLGADFSDYEEEHSEYILTIEEAVRILGCLGRVHVLERTYLTNYLFGPNDIVVAIGQDGMVANTLKYLSGQPLLGVNPSPKRWDGVLLPFRVKDLETITPEVIRGTRKYKEITMASVQLNDNQTMLAVNDFFIGQKTHISARYEIMYNGKSEWQSSSGIIISTGLGATGWLKSILEGAKGLIGELSGEPVNIKPEHHLAWNSDFLYYSVREPFPSKTTGAALIVGKISSLRPLKVTSHMSENGVIFSDGIEHDFLEFNSGVEATLGVAAKKGILIV